MSTPDQARCHEAAHHLQTYLDGEAEPEVAARVHEHLETCRRCGLEAEAYRELKHRLAAASPEVDPDSVARLRSFLDDLTATAAE